MRCAHRDDVVKDVVFFFVWRNQMGISDTKTLAEFVADVV